MATAPPTISALPTPPDPNDRSTFNARAYPWSVAQQTLATQANAVAANVYSNAQAAETGASTASTKAGEASTSASNAATSATTATTKASEASASATAAAGSASAAATSKTGADTANLKASQWADANQNVAVEPGKFSAKHWAAQAQATATGSLIYRGSHSMAAGLFPSSPSLGDYYKISADGVNAAVDYKVGDSIIYNGTGWDKIDSTDSVTSVAGRVGAVVLSKADVGLSLVDNTSDANKPISTATATALANKAPLTGAGTSGTWPVSITGNAATATYSNGATAEWVSAPVASNTTSDAVASAQFRNNGGTGDSNLAAISFYCVGSYGIKLHLRPDGYFGLGGWSSVAWRWYSDPSGNMTASGNVTAYSDPRLKENFKRIDNPMAILNRLDGGTFNWKHGFNHTAVKAGKHDYGILADQVEAVMPEIVTRSIEIEGESYLTVSYEKLVPVLIEAVRQMDARIKELEAK